MSTRTMMDLVDRAERAIKLVREAAQAAREIAEFAKASSAAAWKEWDRATDRKKRHVGMVSDRDHPTEEAELFRVAVAAAAANLASDAHLAAAGLADSLHSSAVQMEKDAEFVASRAVVYVSGTAIEAHEAFRAAEQAEAESKEAEKAVAARGSHVRGSD